MTAVNVYNHSTEQRANIRVAYLLSPYIRDLLGDFKPLIREASFHFARTNYTKLTLTLICVPRDVWDRSIEGIATNTPFIIHDEHGKAIVEAYLENYSLGHERINECQYLFTFIDEASVAICRGLKRVYGEF